MSFDLKIKNGDIVIENGDFKKVTDSEKLIQDILKICLTPVGYDSLNPWYGSYLSKSIIGSAESYDFLNSVAKNQLTKALENLKDLQIIQVKTNQKMSSDEQIASIRSIQVIPNKYDPRVFDIFISVITKGFKNITTSFSVSTI